ncbi:NEP1-interacting protein 1-like [Phragmites australis]|uniref:NEP1-interacting protein 1-like n=1 Tax=Phragmites australis TaxID=29695 RepID=UPI002D7750F8|nr:NEP1-interacting protein 1-like [Phragmites australis]
MSSLYTSLSAISGGGGDDDDYGLFSGAVADACALIVVSCVLAASVIIWEVCAFAAICMAAALVGAAWCLAPRSIVCGSGRRAGTAGEFGPTGAAIDVALPAFPYERRDDLAGGETCSVCLEDVRGGEMVRSLPECRHLFHVGCIDVWLHSHATCPLCRSDLSPRRRVTMAAAAGLPALPQL